MPNQTSFGGSLRSFKIHSHRFDTYDAYKYFILDSESFTENMCNIFIQLF